MEIYKMLTISTGHVSKETADLLNSDDAGVVSYNKGEYGWFVVVTDWRDCENVPDDLKKCLALAEHLDCDWLCLDCEGEIIADLDVYTW